MRVAIYAVLLALVTGAVMASELRREPVYAFDGYAYAVRAQLDAGIPYDRAMARARAVYAGKPAMQRPGLRHWLTAPQPKWWTLFQVRVLYPWLASLLWHRYDIESLFLVSALMYVVATLLTYGYLLALVRPEAAAGIAAAVAALSPMRAFGRSDLTDMTAYAALVAALWAMTVFAKRSGKRAFALAACASTALTLARPLAYVLICAAAPLLFSRRRARGIALVALGIVLAAATAVALALVHAEDPFPARYLHLVAATSRTAATWFLDQPLSIVALIALIVRRGSPQAAIALGAWLSILPTILLDPFPSDVTRVVALPSLVPIACGTAYALAMISRACRATSEERSYAHPDRNTPPRGAHRASRIRTSAS